MAYIRDTKFGDKLDHLEGIIGHSLPRLFFKATYQAQYIKTTKSQFARKRVGDATISNHELASLIDLFRLGRHFDYRLFSLDFENFKKELKEKHVGTYGQPYGIKIRNQLIAASTKNPRVDFLRMSNRKSVGGIGSNPATETIPVFNIFDSLRIKIQIPDDGYLLVLNDHPSSDQLSILKPSRFVPSEEAKKGKILVPDDVDMEAFTVAGPPDFYRIFAIWWTNPLIPFLNIKPELEEQPTVITSTDLEKLGGLLELEGTPEPKARVFVGDYLVNNTG